MISWSHILTVCDEMPDAKSDYFRDIIWAFDCEETSLKWHSEGIDFDGNDADWLYSADE